MQIIIMAAVFLAAAGAMAGLLTLSALIPMERIHENSLRSAEYLCSGEQFATVIEDVEASRLDRYADSILLNIAYCYESRYPLRSVLLSAYYFTPYHEENENFLAAVEHDYAPNQQYMRYWHGSNAIVRPLLTVFDIRQIYTLNAAILFILTATLTAMLLRRKKKQAAIALLAGLIAGSSFFVPLSLEYTWTFMVMLVSSMVALRLSGGDDHPYALPVLFMLSGMVTSYLDFLTTETLSLTLPLIILIWLSRKDSLGRTRLDSALFILKPAVSWGIGYVGMWALKWIITQAVFKEDVAPYVSAHISERLGGDMGVSLPSFLFGALTRNIGCLFPAGYGVAGAIAGFLLVLAAAYAGYVYHVKSFDTRRILLLAVTALIPYVRYLVLHNHSYIHFFFTYRAQVATIMAIVLIISELTGVSGDGSL